MWGLGHIPYLWDMYYTDNVLYWNSHYKALLCRRLLYDSWTTLILHSITDLTTNGLVNSMPNTKQLLSNNLYCWDFAPFEQQFWQVSCWLKKIGGQSISKPWLCKEIVFFQPEYDTLEIFSILNLPCTCNFPDVATLISETAPFRIAYK